LLLAAADRLLQHQASLINSTNLDATEIGHRLEHLQSCEEADLSGAQFTELSEQFVSVESEIVAARQDKKINDVEYRLAMLQLHTLIQTYDKAMPSDRTVPAELTHQSPTQLSREDLDLLRMSVNRRDQEREGAAADSSSQFRDEEPVAMENVRNSIETSIGTKRPRSDE